MNSVKSKVQAVSGRPHIFWDSFKELPTNKKIDGKLSYEQLRKVKELVISSDEQIRCAYTSNNELDRKRYNTSCEKTAQMILTTFPSLSLQDVFEIYYEISKEKKTLQNEICSVLFKKLVSDNTSNPGRDNALHPKTRDETFLLSHILSHMPIADLLPKIDFSEIPKDAKEALLALIITRIEPNKPSFEFAMTLEEPWKNAALAFLSIRFGSNIRSACVNYASDRSSLIQELQSLVAIYPVILDYLLAHTSFNQIAFSRDDEEILRYENWIRVGSFYPLYLKIALQSTNDSFRLSAFKLIADVSNEQHKKLLYAFAFLQCHLPEEMKMQCLNNLNPDVELSESEKNGLLRAVKERFNPQDFNSGISNAKDSINLFYSKFGYIQSIYASVTSVRHYYEIIKQIFSLADKKHDVELLFRFFVNCTDKDYSKMQSALSVVPEWVNLFNLWKLSDSVYCYLAGSNDRLGIAQGVELNNFLNSFFNSYWLKYNLANIFHSSKQLIGMVREEDIPLVFEYIEEKLGKHDLFSQLALVKHLPESERRDVLISKILEIMSVPESISKGRISAFHIALICDEKYATTHTFMERYLSSLKIEDKDEKATFAKKWFASVPAEKSLEVAQWGLKSVNPWVVQESMTLIRSLPEQEMSHLLVSATISTSETVALEALGIASRVMSHEQILPLLDAGINSSYDSVRKDAIARSLVLPNKERKTLSKLIKTKRSDSP